MFSLLPRFVVGSVLVCGLMAPIGYAQLRVATYNVALGNTIINARPGLDTVLEAIGDETVGGITKPIDVLLLQELTSMNSSAQSVVDELNSIYGAGVYEHSNGNGGSTGAGRPGLVYNTQTIELLLEEAFGTASTSGQPRQSIRYTLKPVGYDSSATFYTYSDHYKAGTGATNANRRLIEAQVVRSSADALGEGAHIIYAGDYNIQNNILESMYAELVSAGAGQAVDPLNPTNIGQSWSSDSSFKGIHTQTPGTTFDGSSTGGMDDRYDFQMVTGEMLDDEGMSLISGSYHAFGNNGTHTCCNSAITTGTGAALAVLSALTTASDHLPVVADYQLPAKMEVTHASLPASVNLGDTIAIDVFVENIAPVLFANGADELDYDLSVTGDLTGGAAGQMANALAGANTHQITFDTSTLGLKSGTLNVTSSSQSVSDGIFSLPINFEVVSSFLEADFNEDTFVNGADLAQWEGDFGINGDSDADGDGESTGLDFLIWQQQNGMSTALSASQAVPEPATLCLGFGLFVLFGRLARRTRSVR